MDSTRADQLLSEGEALTDRLREKRLAVWRDAKTHKSSRIVAKSARLDYLVSRSMARDLRRWELWCDSND